MQRLRFVNNTGVGLWEWPNVVPRASVGKVPKTPSLFSFPSFPLSLGHPHYVRWDSWMSQCWILEFCWWKWEFSLWTSLGSNVWFPFLLLCCPSELVWGFCIGRSLKFLKVRSCSWALSAINIYDTVQQWCIMLKIFSWFDKENLFEYQYMVVSLFLWQRRKVMVQIIPSIKWFTFFCWSFIVYYCIFKKMSFTYMSLDYGKSKWIKKKIKYPICAREATMDDQ